jgi:hypothetical protein
VTVDPIVQVALVVGGWGMLTLFIQRRWSKEDRNAAATEARVMRGKIDEVAHTLNHVLDVRVHEAGELGTAQGKAAGVEQERNRPK